jgi:hypothetical protein
MPLYRVQIEVSLPPQRVMERIRSLMRERRSFGQWFERLWKRRDDPLPPFMPFIGSADDGSFDMYREIHYRNSFLPRIRGYVLPTPTGTRIDVTMSMDLLVAVFMTFWLGMTGLAALTSFPKTLGPAAMFVAGAAIMCGAFFWEAFKAKRILADAFSDAGATSQATTPHAP